MIKYITSLSILFLLLTSCRYHWKTLPQLQRFERNQIFELKNNAYLYRYIKSYAIFPHDYPKNFTMDEFIANPEVGMIDSINNIYYVKIIPKGTKLKFTQVRYKPDLFTGPYYEYRCKILDVNFKKYDDVDFFFMLFTRSNKVHENYLSPLPIKDPS